MKTKLIMLDTPIIVSDEEIKEGDIAIMKDGGKYKINKHPLNNDYNQKIIAGLPDLPSINWNGIEEEFGWIDVEKLATKKYLFEFELFIKMKESSQNDYLLEEEFGLDSTTKYREILGFIEGLKYPQSLNEKKFSLEDMKQAIEIAKLSVGVDNDGETCYSDKSTEQIIQSLQQPKVFDIEVEMETTKSTVFYSEDVPYSQPKITNNSIKILRKI